MGHVRRIYVYVNMCTRWTGERRTQFPPQSSRGRSALATTYTCGSVEGHACKPWDLDSCKWWLVLRHAVLRAISHVACVSIFSSFFFLPFMFLLLSIRRRLSRIINLVATELLAHVF